ncbi:MAG: glycosyltransferase [Actinomycetota bacterium]|nr:glycosyltransferase [Actinomycetota bacterium]
MANRSHLRILFVCGSDFRAPSEKQVLWFAQALCARGHAVMISLHGDERSAEEEGASQVQGLEIHWHGYRGYHARRSDVAAVRSFGPDIIHAWYSRPPVCAPAESYARATGAPVLVHWEDDEWGQLAGLTPRSPGGRARHLARKALHRLQPGLWNLSTRRSLDWAVRQSSFDALTPEIAREVSERTGLECRVLLPAASPLAWVANPATASDLLPAELRGRDILLYTGDINFGRAASVRLALDATAKIQRRGHRASFVHAGRNTDQFDLAANATDAGMDMGTAVTLGNLPYPRIPGLLREAAVLLQPGGPTSFNRFGLPSKLQSYLASGTPCVMFAVGAGELLTDRVEVLKTYTGESAELADRIDELLNDDQLRGKLSRNGPLAARRLFDPDRNTDALLEHYRVTLARLGR